jgi:hypothetical protein
MEFLKGIRKMTKTKYICKLCFKDIDPIFVMDLVKHLAIEHKVMLKPSQAISEGMGFIEVMEQ